jgi:hypothetical protein
LYNNVSKSQNNKRNLFTFYHIQQTIYLHIGSNNWNYNNNKHGRKKNVGKQQYIYGDMEGGGYSIYTFI